MFFFFFDEATGKTEKAELDNPLEEMGGGDFNSLNENVRHVWHKQENIWYFSVIDVVEQLTESAVPKQYIKKMRSRDPELNSNWGTICTPVGIA